MGERAAPVGLGYTSRKYFTRDELPLEFGTKVKVLPSKEPRLSQDYVGVVRGYRTRQNGNYQEWEYRVMLWRTNQWWIPASHLVVVAEPAPHRSTDIEIGDLVSDSINGYQGIVSCIEYECGKPAYINFKRTFNSWSSSKPGLGFVHRLKIKNVTLLKKECKMPEDNCELTTDDKVNLILEHLGLEVSVEPAKIALVKKVGGDIDVSEPTSVHEAPEGVN